MHTTVFFPRSNIYYWSVNSLNSLSRNNKTTNPSVQICVYPPPLPPGDEDLFDYGNRNAGRLKGRVAAALKGAFEKVVQHNLPQQPIVNKLANKRAPHLRRVQQK